MYRRRLLQLAGSSLALAGSPLSAGARAPRAVPAASIHTDAGPVLLNLNECPYGPSPTAQQAARDSVVLSGRYRLALAAELREAVARSEHIDPSRLQLYPGSSEPLNRAALVWTGPEAALVTADPTFETLGQMAAARGAVVHRVPLRDDGAHDVRAMVEAAARQPTGVIYVCNPNNPTGSITPRAELEWLLANKPATTKVLLDEAYLQYSEQASMVGEIETHEDLIVLRTFSKLYGMAGMRLGVAVAHAARLAELATQGSNPVPVPALAAGLASLRDPLLVPQRRLQNAQVRQATIGWLGQRGFASLPSDANCFMVDVGRDGAGLIAAMKAQGVLIGRSWPIWPQRVRVTVGTEEEMQRFRDAFAKVTED